MPNLQKVLKWLRTKGEPGDPVALQSRVDELEGIVETLKTEHQNHLTTVRHERDSAIEERDGLFQWMDHFANAIDQDVPSILEQSPWPVGFYSFGKAQTPDVRYFNCSLVNRKDGDWLVARRAREVRGSLLGMNDVVAFKLDGDTPSYMVAFSPKTGYKDNHFEDPRASIIKGQMHVSCCSFQLVSPTKWSGAHQCILKLFPDWSVQSIVHPIYGKNGGSLIMNEGNEKNWLWFEHDGKPHMVYQSAPFQVVEFNDYFEPQKVYETTRHNPLWQHGQPRGGTPPVRVGDEYFTFFHSSTPWVGAKRRYHMGAIAFEAKPPFAITRMSSLPILSGSKNDRWVQGLPLVVFPCGAILRDGKWTVSMGVNDCESAWIKIPHEELLQTLRVVAPPPKPASVESAPPSGCHPIAVGLPQRPGADI